MVYFFVFPVIRCKMNTEMLRDDGSIEQMVLLDLDSLPFIIQSKQASVLDGSFLVSMNHTKPKVLFTLCSTASIAMTSHI